MALPSDRFHVLHAHVLENSDRVLRQWLLAEKEELIILNWVRLEALVHWAQVQQQVIEVVSWPSYDLKATARDCLLQGCVQQSLLRYYNTILLTAFVDEFRDFESSLIIVADAAVLVITLHWRITHAARRFLLLITCLAAQREVLSSRCGWWIASRYFLRWCLRLATEELFLLLRCSLLASFKHFRPAEAVSESESFRGAVDCSSQAKSVLVPKLSELFVSPRLDYIILIFLGLNYSLLASKLAAELCRFIIRGVIVALGCWPRTTESIESACLEFLWKVHFSGLERPRAVVFLSPDAAIKNL